jgi:UDP-N-acetylglucosamine 2-epimerase (non-hydrolysing)
MFNSDYKILVLFGTRPEAIKLAPVISELKRRRIPTTVVSSSQHTDLLVPFLKIFDISVDHDLKVMTENQTPNAVCAKVLQGLDAVFDKENPNIILVQGDTTTAFAGAFAGFNRRVPVGHVEAGLRSGNINSPFPEEMNRRLVSQVAAFHFAATGDNVENLRREGVDDDKIFLTGNTVVDALHYIRENAVPSENIAQLLRKTQGFRRLLLTTHRRESFGEKMSGNLLALRDFVLGHPDVCLLFPVHPNPNVRGVTNDILAGCERVHLLEPLDYTDFICLMKEAWLIASDSGGVQEESPSMGKPVLILRENTERPEAVASGVAKLVGGNGSLGLLLEENYSDETWINSVRSIVNPFGDGRAAEKIVDILVEAQKGADGNLKSKIADAR